MRFTQGSSQYDPDENENDNGNKLEKARPEFFLCISQCAEDVDGNDRKPEDGDPNSNAHTRIPILDCQSGDGELQRQDDCPLENIVPAHGETPRRIDKASRVGVKPSRDRKHNSKFTKRIDDVKDHDADDSECDEKRTRTLVSIS